jgi:glycosyltransferase involved in cell wall biosynthesis
MDDCSPDNTAEVALSFHDRRVKHIRNDPNLGHLSNYNKGIALTRGRYIWLISADDYLFRDYVLQKYVDLLGQHSNVGYTFCPGVAVGSSSDNGFKEWISYGQSVHGKSDRIFEGHVFLKHLLQRNTIVAASALVRRECYEKMGLFPIDMPWAGDWYLWCLFALQFDVGYFAEPMVCYREHERSMTNKLWNEDPEACCEEDVTIPWEIKRKADGLGFRDVSKRCVEAVAASYVRNLVSERYRMSRPSLSLEQFEHSLLRHTEIEKERNWIRARVLAGMASEYFWQGDRLQANQLYKDSLKMDPWMMNVYAKRLLLSLGGTGDFVWKWLKA